MGQFERSLVNAFNNFFESNGIDGIAYRRKQHRFTSQFLDVLVDSEDDIFYIGIENKSFKTSNCNKLYFSQHFSTTKDGVHQVERIDPFIRKSGRRGFLAIEVRRGKGKPKKGFIIPWEFVSKKYHNNEAGISIEEIKKFTELKRENGEYVIENVDGW